MPFLVVEQIKMRYRDFVHNPYHSNDLQSMVSQKTAKLIEQIFSINQKWQAWSVSDCNQESYGQRLAASL